MPTMVERKCNCCGVTMKVRVADVARGWGKFCSKRCKAIKQEQRTGQHARYLRQKEYAEDSEYLP